MRFGTVFGGGQTLKIEVSLERELNSHFGTGPPKRIDFRPVWRTKVATILTEGPKKGTFVAGKGDP